MIRAAPHFSMPFGRERRATGHTQIPPPIEGRFETPLPLGKAGRKIEETDVNFTAHVIGFVEPPKPTVGETTPLETIGPNDANTPFASRKSARRGVRRSPIAIQTQASRWALRGEPRPLCNGHVLPR